MATPSNVTAAVVPGNLEFSDGGMAVDWLTGAFVKSITPGGAVVVQLANGTEAMVQLLVSGSPASWASATSTDAEKVPPIKLASGQRDTGNVIRLKSDGTAGWTELGFLTSFSYGNYRPTPQNVNVIPLYGHWMYIPGIDTTSTDGDRGGNTDPIEVWFRISETGANQWVRIASLETAGAGSAGTVTQESVYEQVKNILLAGTNITKTENDTDYEITLAATGGGGGGGTTLHDGAGEPGALLGDNGDYYFRRSTPPELWLKVNDTWGRIITFTQGLSTVTSLAGLDGSGTTGSPLGLAFENLTAITASTVVDADSVPVVRDSNDAHHKMSMAEVASEIITQARVYEQAKAIISGGQGANVTINDTAHTLTIGGEGLTTVATNDTLDGDGRSVSPLGVNMEEVFDDASRDTAPREDFDVLLDDSGDIYKSRLSVVGNELVDLNRVYNRSSGIIAAGDNITVTTDDTARQITIASTASGRTLEELQDAVAAMFTHDSAYSYDDTNGEIDTTFPEPEASGIVRVYHMTGLSANRSGTDIVASFEIDQVVIGERVQFYAVFNITTVGTGGGSVGEHRVSVSQAGVINSNAEGTFVGQNNLANGVTDTSTGPQYVDGPEYVAFNSIQTETLYIHRPSANANDPSVRYTLSVYMARTKIAQTGDITVRYDDVLDRPILKVSNENAIPTPSSSTVGRRYQTNAGLQYVIEREDVAGTDRVLNFEAYPLTATGFQGSVNNFNDISPGTLTNADDGKWWMIREYLLSGTAPFVLIDSNGSPQNVAHIPDSGYSYLGHYRTQAAAEADPDVAAMSVVIYPDAQGLEQLYRPDNTFVAGTPQHEIYVIVPVDLQPNMVDNINHLIGAVANKGPDIEVHTTQNSYDNAASDDNKIHLLAIP